MLSAVTLDACATLTEGTLDPEAAVFVVSQHLAAAAARQVEAQAASLVAEVINGFDPYAKVTLSRGLRHETFERAALLELSSAELLDGLDTGAQFEAGDEVERLTHEALVRELDAAFGSRLLEAGQTRTGYYALVGPGPHLARDDDGGGAEPTHVESLGMIFWRGR